MSEPILVAQQVVKRFDDGVLSVDVLRGIDLQVPEGAVYDYPLSTLDLIPTFIAAAGGDPSAYPDFAAFKEALNTRLTDQELRRAQAQLRDEAADLALEIAATKLTDTVGDADRERLMDEFITRVEPNGAAEGASR